MHSRLTGVGMSLVFVGAHVCDSILVIVTINLAVVTIQIILDERMSAGAPYVEVVSCIYARRRRLEAQVIVRRTQGVVLSIGVDKIGIVTL